MILNYQEEKRLEDQNKENAAEHRIATVTAVSGKKMRLQFEGEDNASNKYYRGIATVSAGKRVLCARVSGTYVVLGELL